MKLVPALLLLMSNSAFPGFAQQPTRYYIHFNDLDSSLNPAGRKTLDSLITFRVVHAASRFIVYAHSGETASPATDGKFAKKRAFLIDGYLRQRGFHSEHIVSHWSDHDSVPKRGSQHNYVEVQAGPPPPPAAVSISIDTTPINSTFALQNILFIDGKDTLLPEAMPVLRELKAAMAANPRLTIRLEGHVCCGANDAAGIDLSKRRAHAVRDFLTQNGVPPERLESEGFGFLRPLRFPEKTAADKKANRRVEVRIMAR